MWIIASAGSSDEKIWINLSKATRIKTYPTAREVMIETDIGTFSVNGGDIVNQVERFIYSVNDEYSQQALKDHAILTV